MKKQIAAVMIGVLCIGTFTACAAQKPMDRTVITKDDKQIVVIDDKQNQQDKGIALDKIQSFEGIRVLDWISEDTILIMKENKNMPQMQVEEGMAYPKNFYELNINTKEEKLVAESKVNMSSGILSPDKKHIFYKEGVEESLTGYILDRETGKKTKVTDIDSISSYEGSWIDNSTVLFASFPEGKIYTADINGNVKEIPMEKSARIYNTAKLGDNIFYITMDGKLYKQNIDGSGRKLIVDNAVWAIPSPDMTRFAMLKQTAETKRTLYITDTEGKELKKLTEATQIYGISWSPDQSKVAYVVMEPENNSGALYVADAVSGQTVQLSVDINNAADPLKWSPSGKQVSVTNIVFGENSYKFITNLLQLK